MDAANAHLLTPIPYHVYLQLLLDSQHLIIPLYAQNRVSLRFQFIVVRLDLLVRCALIRTKLRVAVEVGRKIFKDNRVVHENFLVPAWFLGVCRWWDGTYVCCYGQADRMLDVRPLQVGRENAEDWRRVVVWRDLRRRCKLLIKSQWQWWRVL